MSNLCVAVKNQESWAYTNAGVFGNPAYIASQASNAGSVGYTFDADVFGISCVAFANNASSDTLLSYQTQINSLQTTIASLNTQIAALVAGNTVAPPNSKIITAEMAIFGAVLACAAAIYGFKRILNLFTSHPDA